MPLHGDDFNWIDAAVRDSFKGILYELAAANSGNMILGGCAFSETLTDATIAEGYVMLNWEVLYVPAITYTKTSLYTFLVPDIHFDPSGSEVFANGSTQDTYQVRRAKLDSFPSVGTPQILMSTNNDLGFRFSNVLYGAMMNKITESSSVSFFNGCSSNISNPVRLYRHFRQVNFMGDVTLGTLNGSTFTKIAQLPVGYRPAKGLKVICAAFDSGLYGSIMVEVQDNGDVYAILVDSNTYFIASLDISFVAQ